MNDNQVMEKYKSYEPFFGSWYLKRFIGEGGFAKVFEIVRSDFGNDYNSALKIITISKTKTEIDSMRSEGMSEDDIRTNLRGIVEDTVREIKLMYQLRGNGNIVGYEDHMVVEHEDGLGWDILIKMEFLTSLHGHIKNQNGRLTKRDVVKLGIDICKALESCQQYNIIHRDIKADNIFISSNGNYKLGDFGIARVIERKDMELSRKGTSAYMAPEVYKGLSYTSAVDIYSLGMVMYRLLNYNRGPFLPEYPQPMSLNDRDHAMMRRMSGEKLPMPGQIKEGRLADAVLKACAYRPEDRFESPQAMRRELEAILADQAEMADQEAVFIYEGQGEDSSGSPKRTDGPAARTETDATEVLREEPSVQPATQQTEQQAVSAGLQSPVAGSAMDRPVMGEQTVNILCPKCRSAINRDAAFCPVCGANQREAQEPEKKDKGIKSLLAKLGRKKAAVIGGACAFVLVAGVIIGVVAANGSSGNKKPDESEESKESVVSYDPTPSPEPVILSDSRVIMSLGLTEDDRLPQEEDAFLTTEITRGQIASLTFLDSLSEMPEKAWDVSEDKNKKVMAWASERANGNYDLYIGAEGGVEAPENSYGFFANLSKAELIQTKDGFLTKNVTEMTHMFTGCLSLETLDLSGFDTSNVTDMGYMFYSCSFSSVDVSSFNTAKVTDMQGLFYGCYLLTDVDLSSFNTAKVTNMCGMFNGCRSLVSVDVSSFDTSNVTDMSLMFYDCRNLASLDISGFETASLTNVINMFFNCSRLNGLYLQNFNRALVATMQYTGTEAGVVTFQGYTFSEAYRQEFEEYTGWHETFIHLEDAGRITHILYINPLVDDRLAEAAFLWDGPRMDGGYRTEGGGMMLTLYGEENGQTAYRMRILTMKGDNSKLSNLSEDTLMSLFDATAVDSVVLRDDANGYGIVYLVNNKWTGADTALVYAFQDYRLGVICLIDYSVKEELFDLDRDYDLITGITAVNLEDYGIDKRTGFLGE